MTPKMGVVVAARRRAIRFWTCVIEGVIEKSGNDLMAFEEAPGRVDGVVFSPARHN